MLFVITSMPVGGAETLLVNMLDGLNPQHAIGEVACLKEPGPLGDEIADRIALHHRLIGGKYDVRVLFRLAALMRRRDIDAVVTIGAGDKMFWGRLAAWYAGVPVIASALHSTGWPDGVGRLNRMLTPITDAFIAVAASHGEFMKQHERFPDDRVHVIRNGIDTKRFSPDPASRSEVRAELGLDHDSQLVGIIAALRPEKNHEMFVRVADRVSRENPKAHFVIVGRGPEQDTIQRCIDHLGCADHVHLLGNRSDTPRLLAAMDVFCLCSHNEASPVSILEALACQVPVIATDVGSISETVRDGQTGYLISKQDDDAMVDHVHALLGDSALREQLAARGRALVQETGSLDSMIQGYTDLLTRIHAAKRSAVTSGTFAARLSR
ncbi:MAG: glycosyltransferase, partial [Planctomycetota bacterium]